MKMRAMLLFCKDSLGQHNMDAHIAIYQLRNVYVGGYAAQHIGIGLGHLFFLHQVADHLPNGDMGSDIQIPVTAHGDDMRGGLGPREMEAFAFMDDKLQFCNKGGLDSRNIDFSIALGGMAIPDLEQGALYKYRDKKGGTLYQ